MTVSLLHDQSYTLDELEVRADELRTQIAELEDLSTSNRGLSNRQRGQMDDARRDLALFEEAASRRRSDAAVGRMGLTRNDDGTYSAGGRDPSTLPGVEPGASFGSPAYPRGRDRSPAAARDDEGIAPSLLPSADVLTALARHAEQGRSLRVGSSETRATVLSTDTGADQLTVQLASRAREPRRISRTVGIPRQDVPGITSVAFPVFGSGDAAVTPEGDTKTEYDAVSSGDATPQMITIWTDFSRQTLLSMINFEAKLRTVLSAKVARREDELVLSAVTGTSDIQTLSGTLDADLVLEGAAMIAASEVGAEPDLVAVNPADVPALVGTDVGTGGSASPSLGSFLPSLHGLMIYPTTHVTAGEAVLGAWGAASRFISGLAPTFLVDATSGIKSNRLTTLLEEAVALAVDEPQGFLHITPEA